MRERTKRITVTALLCAMAYVALQIKIPVSFLTYDMKDVIISIAGFLYGPIYSLIVTAIVTSLEMVTISSTGVFGLIMNFCSSAIFNCTAAIIYKKFRNIHGAHIGLAVAVIFTAGMMMPLNYFIAPLYLTNTTSADVVKIMLPLLLPFNLLKCAINATIISLIYKPVTEGLRRAELIPALSVHKAASKKAQTASIVFGIILLIACAVLFYLFYMSKQ